MKLGSKSRGTHGHIMLSRDSGSPATILWSLRNVGELYVTLCSPVEIRLSYENVSSYNFCAEKMVTSRRREGTVGGE
jgi:hypothetical protein